MTATKSTRNVKPLRLGVAGLGVGSMYFLPNLETYEHVRIVAAADSRAGALHAFAQRYDARTYDSVEALCDDPEIDVVWVATPNQFHCEHTILAADHKKHVICTKPMALSVDEARRMCEAAERNGVQLVCGQTFSMSPDIQALWSVVRSGELGRLISVNTWFSTDWLLKPRVPEELDEALGGGVVYRHGPHLIDTVRLLGGGRVRSVRASVGRWMKERPCPGNFSAFLEFEDGTPATIAYNGYGFFDTSEMTWGIGERMFSDEERVDVRQALRGGTFDNAEAKERLRFGALAPDSSHAPSEGAPGSAGTRSHMRWFGVTVASCERGDVRQSPNGLYVYSDAGRSEIPVYGGRGTGMLEMRELYEYLVRDTPIVHDGRWGLGTLEVATTILQSARERREVLLTDQCAIGSPMP
jgi:phthalate 4,5-cis-dihydrodiol dehydrogenase